MLTKIMMVASMLVGVLSASWAEVESHKAGKKRLDKTFGSPFQKADFGSPRITITVGPEKRVLDFSAAGE